MFHFFRKYQKLILSTVFVLMVASIAFVGTYSTLSPTEMEQEDRVWGVGLDGNEILESQYDGYVRLLERGKEERGLIPEGQVAVLFNDGVFQKDFIETGLLQELAARHWEEIAPEFAERLKKVRAYRFFSHPALPGISLEKMWGAISPEVLRLVKTLQKTENKEDDDQLLSSATLENFALYLQLFEWQNHMPPSFVKKLLFYYARQQLSTATSEALQIEQALYQDLINADFSLFHFHTLEEWFGPRLLQEVVKLLTSRPVSSRISPLESMEKNARAFLAEMTSNDSLKSSQTSHAVRKEWEAQLRGLRISKEVGQQFWADVLSLRAALSQGAESIDVALTQEELARCEKVDIELFTLPEALQFASTNDMRAFLVYQKITQQIEEEKVLKNNPHPFRTQFPFLFESSFEVIMSSCNRSDLALSISLPEIRKWQVSDPAHWEMILQEFPFMAKKMAHTPEERLAAIAALSPEFSQKVRKFTIDQILHEGSSQQGSSEREKNLLSSQPKERITLHIAESGEVRELPSFKSGKQLQALLEQALLVQAPFAQSFDPPSDESNAFVCPSLACYLDGDTFYHFEPIELKEETHLLLFSEIRKRNLSSRLSGAYADLFSEKEHLQLLDSIEQAAHTFLQENAPTPFLEEDAARLYFLPRMVALQQQMASLGAEGEDFIFETGDGFLFELERKSFSLTQESKEGGPFEGSLHTAFDKQAGQWSSWGEDSKRPWFFYQVLSRGMDLSKKAEIETQKKEEIFREIRKKNAEKLSREIGMSG